MSSLFRSLSLPILSIFVACGGGGGASAPAQSGGGGGGGGNAAIEGVAQLDDDGTPRWVKRGSVAAQSGEERAFYGVGSASGIKNPALLRTTTDNRARAELSKVFEVFSASLMKDYQASHSAGGKESGEQSVENAIKTLSSTSMQGVEIVDRYIGDDGTMYALAKLDLRRVADVAKAKEMGAFQSYGSKVDVNDIFDKHGKKDAPKQQSAPPVSAATGAGVTTPQKPADAGSGAASTSGGQKPAWVDGEDSRYPYLTHLCGVGFGGDRTAAENASYAAISRLFVVRVASVSQDFMGAYSKTGAAPLEIQSSETLNKVSTDKVLSGVRIAEVWDSTSGMIYALACLERDKAARILKEQIGEAEATAGRHLNAAGSADKAGKVRELSRALEAIAKREALNGELRIVDANGFGVSGEYSHVDVSAALEEAVQALKIAVTVSGPYDGDLRGALVEGLTAKGYQIYDDTTGADVALAATVRTEDGGAPKGNIVFSRVVVQIDVKNQQKGSAIGSFNESRKEGHRNKEEAERRAIRELAKKLVGQVSAKVDQAMKR